MADLPLRHTRSERLKRLLRRRGRRAKAGANTREPVYGWAEYGQANFTPTADRSWLTTLVGLSAAIGAFLIVPAIFFLAATAQEGGPLAYLEALLAACATVLMIAVLCLPMVIPVTLIAWIYARLDGDTKTSRKRLVEAADKLRETQGEVSS